MITQIKTFIIENPAQLEETLNKWLTGQDDIEVQQIYPLVVVNEQQKPVFMFILIYRKEGWK